MGTYYAEDHGNSRLYDASEANPSAENGDYTDWASGDEFILVIQVCEPGCNKTTTSQSFKLQFSEDGGAWTDVGSATAIAWGTGTTLVDGATGTPRITTDPAGCYGETHAWTYENEGDNLTGSYSIGSSKFGELQWALDPANSVGGSVYTFRVVNVTDGNTPLTEVIASSVTMVLVTDPEPEAGDDLTVEEEVTVSVGDLTISSFSEADLLDVVVDAEVVSVVIIADIVLFVAEAYQVIVYDEVTIDEDITITSFKPNIPVVINEDISIDEDIIVVVLGGDLSVYDNVTVEEWSSISFLAYVSVFDEISVGEDVSLYIPVNVLVYDEIILEDGTTVEVTDVTVVTPPWDDYDQDGTMDENTNARFIIPDVKVIGSGNSISITLASRGTEWSFDSMYVGHPAASGDVYDFDGNQVQILFDGLTSKTITATTVSDIVAFELDASRPLIFAFFFNDATQIPEKTSSTEYDLYYKIGADESPDTDVTDYTQHPTYYLRRFISKITVYSQSQGGELVISSAENIALTEFVKKAVTPHRISVYSSTDVVDNITAVMGDLEVVAFTDVSIDEYLDFENDLALFVVSDVSVDELSTTVFSPLSLLIFDEISVLDDVTVVMGDLAVFAFSQVNVDEYLEFENNRTLFVSSDVIVEDIITAALADLIVVTADEINVDEYNSVVLSDLSIVVFSTADITEYIDSENDLALSVYSSIAVADWVDVENALLPDPQVDVFDELTVTDAITVLLSDIEAVVYDELAVADVVTINNSLLYTSVYDEVSVDEDVSLAFESTISLYDSVTVQESITLSNFIAGINTFSAVTVTEFISFAGVLFTSVYDEITVQEFVSVVVPLGGINVADDITVTEYIAVTLSDLTISLYDDTSVLDIPTVSAESAAVLYVTVNDEIVITEYVLATVITGIALSVGDDITVSEYVGVEVSVLLASAYEEVNVFESVDIAFESAISVFDEVTIGEYVVASVGDLGISKIDNVSVTDYVLLQNILSDISVYDALAVTDTINILCEISGISVYDSITVNDDVAVNLGVSASYEISVVDTITAIEYTTLFSPEYSINVSDTIIVTEAVYFLVAFIIGKLKINVDTDCMGVDTETDCLVIKAEAVSPEFFTEVA